jgi:hypothetical protein
VLPLACLCVSRLFAVPLMANHVEGQPLRRLRRAAGHEQRVPLYHDLPVQVNLPGNRMSCVESALAHWDFSNSAMVRAAACKRRRRL